MLAPTALAASRASASASLPEASRDSRAVAVEPHSNALAAEASPAQSNPGLRTLAGAGADNLAAGQSLSLFSIRQQERTDATTTKA